MFSFSNFSISSPVKGTAGLKPSSSGKDFMSDRETPELLLAILARKVAVTFADSAEVIPYLSSKKMALLGLTRFFSFSFFSFCDNFR